jgi:hypothetical protein
MGFYKAEKSDLSTNAISIFFESESYNERLIIDLQSVVFTRKEYKSHCEYTDIVTEKRFPPALKWKN